MRDRPCSMHQTQPSKEIDELIRSILADRPEWRQRMAVMTRSALLRQRILDCQAPGGRTLGCTVLREVSCTIFERVQKYSEGVRASFFSCGLG